MKRSRATPTATTSPPPGSATWRTPPNGRSNATVAINSPSVCSCSPSLTGACWTAQPPEQGVLSADSDRPWGVSVCGGNRQPVCLCAMTGLRTFPLAALGCDGGDDGEGRANECPDPVRGWAFTVGVGPGGGNADRRLRRRRGSLDGPTGPAVTGAGGNAARAGTGDAHAGRAGPRWSSQI